MTGNLIAQIIKRRYFDRPASQFEVQMLPSKVLTVVPLWLARPRDGAYVVGKSFLYPSTTTFADRSSKPFVSNAFSALVLNNDPSWVDPPSMTLHQRRMAEERLIKRVYNI